jgi:Mce-associated membrane protein
MADDAATTAGQVNEADAEKPDEPTDEAAASDAAAASEHEPTEDDADTAEDDVDTEDDDASVAKAPLSNVRLALIAGLVTVLALSGLVGWLGYRAHHAHALQEQRSVFLAVGRQGAVNLTTIDFEHVDDDVKRIVDSATGGFYDQFQQRAQPFAEVVKQVKSKSVGNVTEAGLESASATEAKVLVAVTVNTAIAGQPEQAPRAWRMRISVQKVGDDVKVSNVEFVQ